MIRRTIFPFTLALAVPCGCDPAASPPSNVVRIFGGVGLNNGLFSYPRAIAAERTDSVFVVDKSGRVQRFARDGRFETSWSMPETAKGKPVGLAVHPDGRIFVADTHYHRIMIYDRDGNFLGSFGSEGMGDGQFQLPTDVAFDRAGFIYVSEYYGNDRVTKWSPDLTFIKAFGDEPIHGERLSRPVGLVVDDEETIWVADACHHRLVRFDSEGRVLNAFGEFGDNPGQMRYPYDLSMSPDGTLLVCEYEGARLQWFTKDGRSVRLWGRHGRKPGELFAPWGATYGPGGCIYVCDSLNSRIQVLQP